MKFFILFFAISCVASEPKTVCLNMIVKDEALVIEKCLQTVAPLIDYWVIVDTGSSDDTKEIVKRCLKDIPGQLHERPWVHFEHNRNEALQLAKGKGDYLLLIDADEILEYAPGFSFPTLTKDLYYIPVCQLGAAKLKRNGLINNHLDWKWKGVLHEVLECSSVKSAETLKGILNLCNTHAPSASGRSKISEEEKYFRDAKTLEAALSKDPDNSRYAYYLGISYAAAKKPELAKKSFQKRISMPSEDVQETFLAYYNLGLSHEILGELDAALETHLQAYVLRPTRAEPLFHAAKIYRKKGNLSLAYALAKHAQLIPYPEEDTCVQYVVYDHALQIELANCALLLNKFEEGLTLCEKLLANPNLPLQYRASVAANREVAIAALHQQLTIPR